MPTEKEIGEALDAQLNTTLPASNQIRLRGYMFVIRIALHRLFRPLTNFHPYEDKSIGYKGWIDLPLFGVVAFVKKDNSLLYRW